MGDTCATPDYDEGPCHCAFHDPRTAREERIDGYCGDSVGSLAAQLVAMEDKFAEVDRLREHLGELYGMFKRLREEEADRADRFELAWKSARRRAADEANFGMEALALRDAEIARLKAELRQTTSAPRLVAVGPDGEGGTAFQLVEDGA